MEQSVNDIVERIDKLIKGWEREYGITNQTMVDARNEIINLRGYAMVVRNMASYRKDNIEEYIKMAKQAVADYEASQ